MRVENPKFDEIGEVECSECPLHELESAYPTICMEWMTPRGGACPNAETYPEASRWAEEAAKGGKG